MPEVIWPCPACGSNDSECIFGEDEMYSGVGRETDNRRSTNHA